MFDNAWRELVNFIMDHRLHKKFTRKEMLNHFRKKEYRLSKMTLDVYRRYLTKAGYVERTSQGQYKRIDTIPRKITKQTVYEEGYINKWWQTLRVRGK